MSKAPQFAHQQMIDSKKMGIIDQQDTQVAVIKFADMSERMQQHAVDCCQFAFQQKKILDDIAEILKTEFDIMYEPTWHCIVGRGMGGYITHQAKNFIFFHWGEVGILLWRTDSINPSQNIQFQ